MQESWARGMPLSLGRQTPTSLPAPLPVPHRAVDIVCREGPARVLELARLGAAFTRNADGGLHLTREGGHSDRRIVHAADATGAEISRALLAAARQAGNISFFEHFQAIDLVIEDVGGMPHCLGVDVLDAKGATATRFLGLATMLASGGAGQVREQGGRAGRVPDRHGTL
jgi:L-aspartate oxidase